MLVNCVQASFAVEFHKLSNDGLTTQKSPSRQSIPPHLQHSTNSKDEKAAKAAMDEIAPAVVAIDATSAEA